MWYNIVHSFSAETEVFMVTIVIFTLIFHLTYSPATAAKAPAFLTTIGILGTFIGIAIGLLEFSADDVQKSVPKLIEGIKTAVWASAFGIFCALTIKLRDIEGFSRKNKGNKVTAQDMLYQMEETNNLLAQLVVNVDKLSAAIQKPQEPDVG